MHDKCEIGDDKHYENMEHKAEVKKCLTGCQYGKEPGTVARGISGDKALPISGEATLATFLAKSELRKDEDDCDHIPNKDGANLEP